ncbi:hypothetical protein BD413DRAFT_616471 [Trametes elegans]|nr:hypothetical protein BD413DRAFT_616471 [Trametes elegans]
MASKSTPIKPKGASVPANTHADVAEKAVQKGWESELKDRIHEFPGSAEQFIDTLLPNATPFPDDDDIDVLEGAFDDYAPEKGKELSGYPHLISGLRKLVAGFEESKRPHIDSEHRTEWKFPFDAFAHHHHKTFPDICVSFPGEPLVEKSWQSVAMVMEAKGGEEEDPFPRDVNGEHARTIAQLAKNARNLLLAHGFLAAFVVGVYGKTIRLARFDHSCSLVAPPISLARGQGGVRLLKKFFWHFTHPRVGNTVVGADPTVTRMDAETQAWVISELKKSCPTRWREHTREVSKGRIMEIFDEKTGRCRRYVCYRALDSNGRLFSRATMVWLALLDTRKFDGNRWVPVSDSSTLNRPRIVKEAWRQLVRMAETEIYKRLEEKIPAEKLFGLARMECGGDIGLLEYQWWEESRRLEAARSNTFPNSSHNTSDSCYLEFRSTGSVWVQADPADLVREMVVPPQDCFPLPYPQHQTFSTRLEDLARYHRERSHMRMVISDVGRPLTEFGKSKRLARGMRDALLGHQLAWEVAGVLHRDVSLGNILLVDDPNEDSFFGFMHDWDYSSKTLDKPRPDNEIEDSNTFKERTGTYYFMALELINPSDTTAVIHLPSHDLESFYWVLLWVVLRHTECIVEPRGITGRQACADMYRNDEMGYSQKHTWLTDRKPSYINIPNNRPLTTLMNKLHEMVSDTIPHRHFAGVPLTYDAMLAAFDEALEMEGWPEDEDWIPCDLTNDFDHRTNVAVMTSIPAGYEDRSEGLKLRSRTIGSSNFSSHGATPSSGPPSHAPLSVNASRSGPVLTAGTSNEASPSTTEPPASNATSSRPKRSRDDAGLVTGQPDLGHRPRVNKRSRQSATAAGTMAPPAALPARSGGGTALPDESAASAADPSAAGPSDGKRQPSQSVPPLRSSERIRRLVEKKAASGSGSGSRA